MATRIAEALAILLAVSGVVLLFVRVRTPRKTQPTDGGRRAFLNRAMLGALTVFGVAFTGGSMASLWPKPRAFGSKIVAGKLDDLLNQLDLYKLPIYNIEGRFYLVKYFRDDPNNPYVQAGAVAEGLMALFQKCSHLGCRVPFCTTSRWFECPCHGAQFNIAGEVMRGPAPAGLWRFPIEVTWDGSVVVDTSSRVAQPPWGTDTIHQQPAGASCLSD